ncbi:MAG: HEAT repeat domain-containing protein [Planctomycetota bacterium]|jgi:HEAT repeat protein
MRNCKHNTRFLNGFCVFTVTAVLLLVGLLTGCAATSSDSDLRGLATSYIRAAFRFPDNPGVRAQAAEATAEVSFSDAGLLIREALRDEHPGVRFAACMALGRIQNTGSISAIRKLVNDSDTSVRIGAYYALERMGDASYRFRWIEMLANHADEAVRRNAAFALGQLDDKDVVPLLHKTAGKDEDEGVRMQALEAMVCLGDSNAIDRFLIYAYGGAGYKQLFALQALARLAGHCKDRAHRERLENAFLNRLRHAEYLESKLASADGLGRLGYRHGYSLALQSLNWNKPQINLTGDPAENQVMRVRSMAARALGEIGDRRALDRLKKRMQTPDDPRVQLAAATAIIKILRKTTY